MVKTQASGCISSFTIHLHWWSLYHRDFASSVSTAWISKPFFPWISNPSLFGFQRPSLDVKSLFCINFKILLCYSPFIFIDDLYITGILRHRWVLHGLDLFILFNNHCTRGYYFFIGYSTADVLSWKYTLSLCAFQKKHIPKRAHSKKGTFQKEHIPKRAHSKKSSFQIKAKWWFDGFFKFLGFGSNLSAPSHQIRTQWIILLL